MDGLGNGNHPASSNHLDYQQRSALGSHRETASVLDTSISRAAASRRRNTTSSVHVHDTMAKPNNDVMCIAVADRLRNMIIAGEAAAGKKAVASGAAPTKSATESADHAVKRSRTIPEDEGENAPPQLPKPREGAVEIPSTLVIAKYLHVIFSTAQCSVDTTLIAWIYITRLLAKSGLHLTVKNWRSLVATGMLLASKVWDDLSMVNADFAVFLPYTKEQINQWERQMLAGMQYDVHVLASTYAKMYFDLRAEAATNPSIREVSVEVGCDDEQMAQLDTERAHKLEALTSVVQKRVDEMKASSKFKPEVKRAVSDHGTTYSGGLESDLPEAPTPRIHHHGMSILD